MQGKVEEQSNTKGAEIMGYDIELIIFYKVIRLFGENQKKIRKNVEKI
jgi:hypothetical protein